MFKEQYIRDNEKLHAKETLLMEIKEKNESGKQSASGRQKWVRYGAVAAAFVLVAGGVIGALFASRSADVGPETQSVSAAETSAVASYDEIYELIEGLRGGYDAGGGVRYEEAMETAADDVVMVAPEAEMQNAGTSDKGNAYGAADYSETNVQVKGVDEADIVKTDGEYIYYVAGSQLSILKADGADTKLVSSTPLAGDDSWWGYNSEMFVLGDRLMIISQGYSVVWVNDESDSYENDVEQTKAIIYDISDRSRPVQVVSLGQSGYYVSARMIGEYVYLVTSQYVYNPVRATPETYIPTVSAGGETRLVETGNLYVSGTPQSAAYTVVGSINLKNGAKHAAVKAVFGGTSEIYANAEHLLLAIDRYDSETKPVAPDEDGKNVQITTGQSSTDLILLGLDEGGIVKLASGSLPGSLLNQFSMDEYQDVFRIVTTVDSWTQYIYTDGVDSYDYESSNYNNLYTLDQDLEVLGKIENVAEDEYVKSVRFDGEIGYFVTFRQIDPLFAVDLSNAKAPHILSSLKIPGFSEYLQTFGSGLLFGIGYSADEDTGGTTGVKLSMFDTGDKTDVKELFTENVDADWTIVGSNHHAILVNAAKNLIAFPADTDYYIYRYDAAKGFVLAAKVDLASDLSGWNLRGLFIGDEFYVLSESGATIISLTSFTVLAQVKLG
jgi:uncharacterized secreted protein with C-terminal beta-propeller domain